MQGKLYNLAKQDYEEISEEQREIIESRVLIWLKCHLVLWMLLVIKVFKATTYRKKMFLHSQLLYKYTMCAVLKMHDCGEKSEHKIHPWAYAVWNIEWSLYHFYTMVLSGHRSMKYVQLGA